MVLRFFGAVICCLFLSDIADIQVKILGQNETGFSKQRIILKCSDDQKINDYANEIQLCKVQPAQRCILYKIRIARDDKIIHPYLAEQKVCVIFQRSTINMLPVDFFKNYSSVKYIDLSNIGLQGIEDFTFSIASMIELNLRGNDLTRLSRNAFNGAVNLASLDLSRNLISFIDPSAFGDLRSLINLNLSHNKLSNQSFSDDDNIMGIDWTIETLRVLDLSHNGIVYYDALPYNSLANMKNLEELYLQHNHIAIDYGAFSSNRNLKTLDFSYNNNPYFEFNLFLSVRKLENIYLNGNGIWHSIDLSDVRSSFPKLTSIGIANNSFSCSHLASMVRQLDKTGIEMVVDENAFVSNVRNIRGVKCI